jgi:4-hydroxybenzoate polyprenyltransferase
MGRQGPRKLSYVVDAIKLEHTVFALPFAYIAMVLAAGGWPGWWTLAWVTAAMVGARTCAMATNRVVDRWIDAQNPRTAARHLPRGLLRAVELKSLAAAGAALMFVAAAMLNGLCLALAPLALAFLVGYSYTKRFTWTSHWILGFTDGIAAAGGWIAVRGHFDAPALVLWLALTVWIAGFDLIYACQDVEFDRAHGLYSVPARFGIPAAIWGARICHTVVTALLVWYAVVTDAGGFFWVGLMIVAGAFVYEHNIVRPHDLSRLNRAFFSVNGFIGIALFVCALLDLLVRGLTV